MEVQIEEQLKVGTFNFEKFCTDCVGFCCDKAAGVQITVEEYNKLVPHLEGIAKLADDPRTGARIASGQAIRMQSSGYYQTGSSTRNDLGYKTCVFKSKDRKCTIHSYALENGIPVSEIKPVPCQLYPIEQVPDYKDNTLHVRISKRSLCPVVKQQDRSEWYVEEPWTDNEKEALHRITETANEHDKTTGYRY